MASDSSRLSQVRTTVDALVQAARTRDRTGFERLISDRDPAFPDRARLLYGNLSTLPLTRLQIRVEPAQFGLAEQRTQLLGSSAWAQRAVVSWRLVGDDTDVVLAAVGEELGLDLAPQHAVGRLERSDRGELRDPLEL